MATSVHTSSAWEGCPQPHRLGAPADAETADADSGEQEAGASDAAIDTDADNPAIKNGTRCLLT